MPAVEAGKGKYSPKLLEAIDWAMEVDEGDRPQSVEAWRQALAGGSRRKSPPKSVRKATTRPTRGTTPDRTGMRWSSVVLMLVIVVLVGAGGWWGWQTYPELFGQGGGDTLAVTERAAPAGMTPRETPQQTETGEASETLASTVVEQPASKELALSLEEAEVARLLAAAETDLKERRLTSPVGNNAWEKYQEVLKLDSGNLEAVAGMEQVIGSYMELFGSAVEQEEFGKAAGYLSRIHDLHPESPMLEEGGGRLEAAKQARADRLAEQERRRQTEAAARQAEEAARQAELERQRIAQAIEAHWVAFEAALDAEDLDEAENILAQARDLGPEASELEEGELRLEAAHAALEQQREEAIKEHWSAFEAALDAEELDKAQNILSQVRSLNPEMPRLEEGQQRLEAAQEQYQAIETIVREIAGQMISIPAGTFRMGTSLFSDGFFNEGPLHSVTVPAFKMGKYEVTFAQWDACVASGGCGGYTPNDEGWGRGNRPVIHVSWDDVQGFIHWLKAKTGGNFRLPTEAEWEYAVRAGSTNQYSWGKRIGNNRANCLGDGCGDRWRNTTQVGSFSANAWGLHDMHGNVREWVQDCRNKNYRGAPTDGRAWLNGDCGQRGSRGGGWGSDFFYLRSANRNWHTRSYRYGTLGFRLAQDP